jgi:hypothetical protein
MQIAHKTLPVLRYDAGVAGRLLQQEETFMAINADVMQRSKAELSMTAATLHM